MSGLDDNSATPIWPSVDPVRSGAPDACAAEAIRVLSMPKASALSAALDAVSAASSLLAHEDVDQMFGAATKLARDVLGFGRVSFYLRELREARIVLRGTLGTSASGQRVDDRDRRHALPAEVALKLQGLGAARTSAVYRPPRDLVPVESDQSVVLREGWALVTPLLARDELVGVMFGYPAAACGELSVRMQVGQAALARLVTIAYLARCPPLPWQRLDKPVVQSELVRKILTALEQSPNSRGAELASQLGVSPGHLSRTFKREMGLSLVEYRNRKRFRRFWETMQDGGTEVRVKQAAMEAGFGSYAQFRRVRNGLSGIRSPRG